MASKLTPITLCLLLLVGCGASAPPEVIEVTLGGEVHELELKLTEAEIRQGMMGREHLDEDAGMLFVFPDAAVRSFWMKNCLIPLDVIFLSGEGRVVSIRTMKVPDDNDNPPSYSSRWPAQFAIELNAGRAEQLGIRAGDQLDLPIDQLKQLVE